MPGDKDAAPTLYDCLFPKNRNGLVQLKFHIVPIGDLDGLRLDGVDDGH